MNTFISGMFFRLCGLSGLCGLCGKSMMGRWVTTSLAAVASVAILFYTPGLTAEEKEKSIEAVKANIEARLPHQELQSVRPTLIDGLYQVELSDGEIMHMTEEGRYIVTGDLIEVVTPAQGKQARVGVINHTEEYRTQRRTQQLSQLDRSGVITYSAKGEKVGEVFAFTDTDCIYCRKFHAEIPKLNAMGVDVTYLAWPRAGVSSATGKEMVKIWCAKNQRRAMDQAKRGKRVTQSSADTKAACAAVITEHMALGNQLGVRGTPALFLANGQQVGGYVQADELIRKIKPGGQ